MTNPDATDAPEDSEPLANLVAQIKQAESQLTLLQNAFDTVHPNARSNDNHPIPLPTGPRTVGQTRNDIIKKRDQLTDLKAKYYDRITDACEYFSQQHQSVKEIRELTDSAKQIAETAIKTVKDAALISSGEPFAAHFERRAGESRNAYIVWLVLTTCFFVSLISYIACHATPPQTADPFTIAWMISNKLITTLLLIGGMVWSAKFFRACYNTKESYSHKIAITRTYQAFESSPLSEPVKNTVVKEATKHIFAPPRFTDEKISASDIEIVKSILSIVKPSSAE